MNTNDGSGQDGRISVAIAGGTATSGDFASGQEASLTHRDDEAPLGGDTPETITEEGIGEEGAEEGGAEEAKAKPEGEKAEGETEAEGETAKSEAPVGDLGEWDGANEETASKFDKHFLGDDGAALDFSKLTAELEANRANGILDINKGSRAYLKDRFLVSDEFINQHIQGVRALSAENDTTFYGKVGGKEAYETKLGWAKDIYTQAQKDRFNAAIKKGGEDAEEAVDLLNARYEKANPAKAGEVETAGNGKPGDIVRKGPPGKRPANPVKNATANAGGAGSAVQPFATDADHRAALKAAGDDKGKHAEVERRLRASPHLLR